MSTLKVSIQSATASFRYPRVQIGRLPTFDMPPPATIYGHIAGVVGDWFDPQGLEFSYVFTHHGKGLDIEKAQPIESGAAGRSTYDLGGLTYPVNVRCEPNPQTREFLLWPRMTLYLRGTEERLRIVEKGFRSPFFSYILGRSQDLAACRVEWVELSEARDAYFSHTLLPYDWRPWILPGISVHMPSAIDYRRGREATYDRYLQVTWPPLRAYSETSDLINRRALPAQFAVDPSDRREFADRVLHRGLHFFPLRGPSADVD